MHFLGSGDAAFARFMTVASTAHRLLERGDLDDFVIFHERVVKLVGMCRNRVRRAAYATSKNMLVSVGGLILIVISFRGRGLGLAVFSLVVVSKAEEVIVGPAIA